MRQLWTIGERVREILARTHYDPDAPASESVPSFIYVVNAKISVMVFGCCEDMYVIGAETDDEHYMAQKLANIAFGNMLEAEVRRRRAIKSPLSGSEEEALVMAFLRLVNPIRPRAWGKRSSDLARRLAADALPESALALLTASDAHCAWAKAIVEEAFGLEPWTWIVLR